MEQKSFLVLFFKKERLSHLLILTQSP